MPKVRAGVLVAGSAMLLLLLLHAAGLLELLELITLDLRYATGVGRRASADDVVIAWIDQESMDLVAREAGVPFPWPRSLYQDAAAYALGGGAKAVIYDILFDQRANAEDDRAAGETLGKSKGDVLAVKFMTSGEGARTPDEAARFSTRAISVDGPLPGRRPEGRVILPITELEQGADLLGFVNVRPDADKVYRRYDLLRLWAPSGDAPARAYPSLGLAAAMVSAGVDGVTRTAGGDIALRGRPAVAAGDDARMLLNFRGSEFTFDKVKFVNILQSIEAVAQGKPPPYPAERFKGKAVLIGINAEGYEDIHPTPLSKVFPGVELHATAIDNLLRGDALWAPHWDLWLGAAAIAATTATVLLLSGVTVPAIAVLVLLLAFGAATMLCWSRLLVLPVAAPVLGLVFAAGGSFLWRLVVEGKQRRQMKRAFSSYMAPEVLAEVLRDPDRIALGGETREVTLFFTDLAGFTGLAEHIGPEALVAFLNDYFTRMCEPILHERGVIDKFIGDAIMALFGAPLPGDDHALRAVRAALQAKAVSETIAAELRAQGKPVIETRIGIHSGPAVVGNMGSAARFDYTAIGDTVNLASRLEGANKAFGTACLVSKTAWQGLGGAVLGREVGLVGVKGRAAPIRVFEPLAMAADAPEDLHRRLQQHEQALASLRRGDRQGALAAFRALPDDALGQLYLERLQDHAWDGVFRLDAK